MSAYNSRITEHAPFDRIELPSLFCWMERIWPSVADDTVPTDLAAWMDYQLERMDSDNLQTWAISKDGAIAGYVEAAAHLAPEPLPRNIARVSVVFKRDLWPIEKSSCALRLVLHELFESGCEMVLFPVFTNNEPLKVLFGYVGAQSLGVTDTSRLRKGTPIETELFALTVTDWWRKNAAFIAEYEAAHSVEGLTAVAGE